VEAGVGALGVLVPCLYPLGLVFDVPVGRMEEASEGEGKAGGSGELHFQGR